MKKRTIWTALVLAVAFLLVPSGVSAGSMDQRGTGSMMVGTNHVTWDSNFVHHDYVRGTPTSIKVDWSATGRISGLVSVGLGDKKITPAGARGRIIGIERLSSNSAIITMEFLEFPRQGVANAHIKLNLAVDDGTGRFQLQSFDVKCHVKAARSNR